MSGKFVTVRLNFAVGEECVSPYDICDFLNDKIKNDPDFLVQIGVENIVNIRPFNHHSSGRTLEELREGHTLE
jgi:hypothetical protein